MSTLGAEYGIKWKGHPVPNSFIAILIYIWVIYENSRQSESLYTAYYIHKLDEEYVHANARNSFSKKHTYALNQLAKFCEAVDQNGSIVHGKMSSPTNYIFANSVIQTMKDHGNFNPTDPTMELFVAMLIKHSRDYHYWFNYNPDQWNVEDCINENNMTIQENYNGQKELLKSFEEKGFDPAWVKRQLNSLNKLLFNKNAGEGIYSGLPKEYKCHLNRVWVKRKNLSGGLGR